MRKTSNNLKSKYTSGSTNLKTYNPEIPKYRRKLVYEREVLKKKNRILIACKLLITLMCAGSVSAIQEHDYIIYFYMLIMVIGITIAMIIYKECQWHKEEIEFLEEEINKS